MQVKGIRCKNKYCRVHLSGPYATSDPPRLGLEHADKNSDAWQKARKLVAKNPLKFEITEVSFGPAQRFLFVFKVPHQSVEESQIFDWFMTGEGPEPS